MAKSNSKKQSNALSIVLIIAIVLVIAAIGFVVFDKYMNTSSVIKNQDFAKALSVVLDKKPREITEKELSNIAYLEVVYDDSKDKLTVVTAEDKFDLNKLADLYSEYELLLYNSAITEEEFYAQANDLSKQIADMEALRHSTTVSLKEKPLMDDLKLFTGLDTLNVNNVTLSSSDVFADMKKLTDASIYNCGLTEVKGLANLDTEAVNQIVIPESGNKIKDWSPLGYIEDKVMIEELPIYDELGNIYSYNYVSLMDKYPSGINDSEILSNQSFAYALAKTMDKMPKDITAEELAEMKYLEVHFEEDSEENKLLGVISADSDFDTDAYVETYQKYQSLYSELNALQADTTVDNSAAISELNAELSTVEAEYTAIQSKLHSASVPVTEVPNLDDIKLFTSLDSLYLNGVSVSSSEVFAGLTKLESVTVRNSGLTEVAGFAGLDAEAVKEIWIIDENETVTDWSPLNYISDKVIVAETPIYDQDGNIFTTTYTTLTEHNASLEENADNSDAEQDTVSE